MSEKNSSYYFQNFMECVQCGYRAAKMLEDNLMNFDTGPLQDRLDEPHKIERDADKKKHEMMGVLVKVLITPIEREDIILLSQSINEVTNRIEDALIRIYINGVHTIKPEAVEFTRVIIRCYNALKEAIEESVDFKKSKILHGLITEISVLGEEGDRMLIDSMWRLHAEMKNPVGIIA